MTAQRAHVVLAQELITEIDRLVGKRHRSEFLVEAASRELHRQRQLRALDRAAGAWKDADHKNLRRGSALYVRGLRKENDRRLARLRPRA